MSTQTNIAASRRILEECFNEGRLDAIDHVCAPDIVGHDPSQPADTQGPESLKDQVRMYRTAFPDLSMTVEDVFASRDEVVTRWRSSGTNNGELMGLQPTGRRVEVTGITIDRYNGAGQISESWTQWDNLGMLQQLGIAEAAMAAAE